MIPDLGGQIDNLVHQLWECDVRYQESVREFKRRFITRVLTAHNGNQCAAAEALGMHRNTLARTIRELKVNFNHRKAGSGARRNTSESPYADPMTLGTCERRGVTA